MNETVRKFPATSLLIPCLPESRVPFARYLHQMTRLMPAKWKCPANSLLQSKICGFWAEFEDFDRNQKKSLLSSLLLENSSLADAKRSSSDRLWCKPSRSILDVLPREPKF